MSYHGYIPFCKQFLHTLNHPTILEVGVDRGVTLFPLLAFLARTKESFSFVGIDVLIQEQLVIMANNLDLSSKQQVFLLQQNSLDALPRLSNQNLKFDLILLDGDHNYYTVSNELKYLESLTYQHSLIIVDDYLGRWSEKDLWYSQREEYKNVKDATLPVDSEKHGVKLAVDEFLSLHSEWKSTMPLQGEPIVLIKTHNHIIE